MKKFCVSLFVFFASFCVAQNVTFCVNKPNQPIVNWCDASNTVSPISLEGYKFPTLASGYLYWSGTAWQFAAGSGSGLTSVGLSFPGILYSSVTNSPLTSNGTLMPQLNTQTANTFFAGPSSGSATTPNFRALTNNDFASGLAPTISAANMTNFPATLATLAGTNNFSAANTFSMAGAASTPAVYVDGAWYNSTNNLPQVYINNGGSQPSFAASTYYGLAVNGPASSTIPFSVYSNGTALFSVLPASVSINGQSVITQNTAATVTSKIINSAASPTADLQDFDITTSSTNITSIDHAGNIVSKGAQNVSGCSLTTALGGQFAGSFKSGTSGTCTVTITPGSTAPNGWSCWSGDNTTTADTVKQTSYTTTTAVIAGTTVSADVITWGCVAF